MAATGFNLKKVCSDLIQKTKQAVSPEMKKPMKRMRQSESLEGEPDNRDSNSTLADIEMSEYDDDDNGMSEFEQLLELKVELAVKPHLARIDELLLIINEKDQRILELEKELSTLRAASPKSNSADDLSSKCDDLEQRSRGWSVRLSGVREDGDKISPTTNTDAIVLDVAKSIGVNLQATDIDWSHYIGKPDKKKGRQLIVRFSRRNTRREFISARKELRNLQNTDPYSSIYINEDLTKIRFNFLRELQVKR